MCYKVISLVVQRQWGPILLLSCSHWYDTKHSVNPLWQRWADSSLRAKFSPAVTIFGPMMKILTLTDFTNKINGSCKSQLLSYILVTSNPALTPAETLQLSYYLKSNKPSRNESLIHSFYNFWQWKRNAVLMSFSLLDTIFNCVVNLIYS